MTAFHNHVIISPVVGSESQMQNEGDEVGIEPGVSSLPVSSQPFVTMEIDKVIVHLKQ